jgi:hypothetical protein
MDFEVGNNREWTMKIKQILWSAAKGWEVHNDDGEAGAPSFILYFSAPGLMNDGARHAELTGQFPGVPLIGCSTGGEILGPEIHDATITATIVWLEKSQIHLAEHCINPNEDSTSIGSSLAAKLPQPGLRAVFVLSDGTQVNGSSLVEGLRLVLKESVIITGGLAGDGADFKVTLVGCNSAPQSGIVAIIGFYGAELLIGHGSFGGWDRFGPERMITRSQGNVLYELDGEPALDLYKRYLGDEAARLPASALLFPLSVRPSLEDGGDVVRTIVGIDEEAKAMIFAGDVPQGYVGQLMRGNFDHLVEGAQNAAESANETTSRSLAILVSCIGRKLLMGQRVVEEVEVVSDVLGEDARLTGFYSYGEISPHGFTGKCQLHNQTMTITTISETC